MNPKDRDATIRTCLELLIRSGSGTMSLGNAVRLLEAGDIRDSALRSGMGSSGAPSHGDIDYSDPTGNTATRGMSSAGRQTIDGIDLRLARILVDLTWIDTERGKALRAPKDPRPVAPEISECRNCGCWRRNTVAPKGGLCTECKTFLGNHKFLPTEAIIRSLDMGRNPTPSQMTEAKAAGARRRNKQEAKK